LKVTSTNTNGNVQATGCERKSDVDIDLSKNNAAGFAAGIKWTTDVATTIVVPVATSLATTSTAPKGDWQTCSTSTECQNQCCSSKYSDGVLKCTPVGGFKTSEGCVGSSTSTPKLGEWEKCSNSAQCNNQCCSGKYSNGVLKCTPVGGFKTSEGCVGSATRRLRGNNEDGVLTADETNTTFMHYAAPVEELGRDVEYGDELN